MNAARSILFRRSWALGAPMPMVTSPRSLHAASLAAGSDRSPRQPRERGQNRSVAATTTMLVPPSAKDIQALLCNIGAGCGASLGAIESLVEKGPVPTTDGEVIDLIARIRSM